MKILPTLFVLTTISATPVLAAMKTVTLSVPGMTCSACPITMKKALTKVKGVTKTDVNFRKRETAVTFDGTKSNIRTLTKATSDAGFPSTLRK